MRPPQPPNYGPYTTTRFTWMDLLPDPSQFGLTGDGQTLYDYEVRPSVRPLCSSHPLFGVALSVLTLPCPLSPFARSPDRALNSSVLPSPSPFLSLSLILSSHFACLAVYSLIFCKTMVLVFSSPDKSTNISQEFQLNRTAITALLRKRSKKKKKE